jgi:hypothetical protein
MRKLYTDEAGEAKMPKKLKKTHFAIRKNSFFSLLGLGL